MNKVCRKKLVFVLAMISMNAFAESPYMEVTVEEISDKNLAKIAAAAQKTYMEEGTQNNHIILSELEAPEFRNLNTAIKVINNFDHLKAMLKQCVFIKEGAYNGEHITDKQQVAMATSMARALLKKYDLKSITYSTVAVGGDIISAPCSLLVLMKQPGPSLDRYIGFTGASHD